MANGNHRCVHCDLEWNGIDPSGGETHVHAFTVAIEWIETGKPVMEPRTRVTKLRCAHCDATVRVDHGEG